MSVDYGELWRSSWSGASRSGPGFRSRYEVLLRLLRPHAPRGRALEIGSGEGVFLRALRTEFPAVHPVAHEIEEAMAARVGEELAVPYAWGALPADLHADGLFELIVASEVIEHIDDDVGALSTLDGLLRPGGLLLLSVPLRPDLWTRVDDAVGHKRRYRRGELASTLRARNYMVLDDLALGFPFYNGYYRRLPPPGREAPKPSAARGLAAALLTNLFVAESRLSTPWGGRGFTLARKAKREAAPC